MVKVKRILAFAGALILGLLFLLAIVLAVTGAPKEHLMAVIFSIVFLTVGLYAMGLATRLLNNSDKKEDVTKHK